MKKGFTLIELLVVISIIAVLSTIGLITFQGTTTKTRDAVRKNDLTTLATALEIYYQTYGNYLINTGSCTDGTAGNVLYTNTNFTKFISGDLPKDPKSKANYCYESPNGLTFKLYAKLEDNTNYILTSEDFIAQVSPTPTPGSGTTFLPSASPTPTPTPTLPTLKVFVTSTTYTGNLGRLSGADQKCKTAADSVPSLQGKLWRAWISDSTVNAKDRISDGKYTLINGTTVVANNKTDFLDGSIAAAINSTETGGSPSIYGTESFPYVWTGTNAQGNATSNVCANWDQPQAASGTVGSASHTNTLWTSAGTNLDPACQTYQRHLYCFEQPAPSSTGGPGCLTAYQDFDNDGYTTGGAVYFCGVSSLPYGYKSSPSTPADCYDQNPNAYPGQTAYFTTNRGDGSFDYDCSSSTQTQYAYWGVSCGTYQVNNTASLNNCFSSWVCTGFGATTSSTDCGKSGSFLLNNQQPDIYTCDESGSSPAYSPNKVTLGCR